MRELLLGILSAYCAICALIMLRDLPGWLIGPAAICALLATMAYIALDLRRCLRRRAAFRRAMRFPLALVRSHRV